MAPGAKRGRWEEADLDTSAAGEKRAESLSLSGRQRPFRDGKEIEIAERRVEAAERE
jgi:hypothetical protein